MKIVDRQAIALSTYGIESPGIVQHRFLEILEANKRKVANGFR